MVTNPTGTRQVRRKILSALNYNCQPVLKMTPDFEIPMRVLGIESSCDETAVAVYDGAQGLLAHALHSQVALHAPHGGVVPELASRDHVRKLLPLVREVLNEAGAAPESIDGLAYTAGPGLVGALLVGATFAQSSGAGLESTLRWRASHGGPFAGAMARAPCARFSGSGAAGFGGAHPAGGSGRRGGLPPARGIH